MVTLALEADVQAVADAGLTKRAGWTSSPSRAPPIPRPSCSWCAAAIPQNIHDWDDLAREGVGVITPNPKTSGGAGGTSWPPGPTAKSPMTATRPRSRTADAHLSKRAGAGFRRPGLHHILCGERPGRRAHRLGERGLPHPSGIPGGLRDRHPHGSVHPVPALGGGGRRDGQYAGHPGTGHRLPGGPVFPGGPAPGRHNTTTAPATRPSCRSTATCST